MERGITLTSIGGGAAVEKFGIEWDRLVSNVLDPNTEPTATRTITIKVTVKPDRNREMSAVTIDCSSKLAPDVGYDTQVYFSVDRHGIAKATEYNPRQRSLFEDDGITPIEEAQND